MNRIRWIFGVIAAAVVFAIAGALSVMPRRRKAPPRQNEQRSAIVDAEARETRRADTDAAHRLAAIRAAEQLDVDASARAVADLINGGHK